MPGGSGQVPTSVLKLCLLQWRCIVMSKGVKIGIVCMFYSCCCYVKNLEYNLKPINNTLFRGQ